MREHGFAGDIGISVNASPYELLACDYASMVAEVLDEAAVDPRLLTVEATENVFMGNPDAARKAMRSLTRLGVRLALDDFGTGYSSLSYRDSVKIDRSFTARVGTDKATTMIVAAIVDLAHGMGMTVVGEGIETAEQRRLLTAMGCELGQGFHFAEPMTAEAAEDLLRLEDHDSGVRLPVPGGVRSRHRRALGKA